jgi:hypothetical protein
VPDTKALDQGKLPPANVAVNIPGLGPCTDSPDRTLKFNSSHPVTVLVHGCNGSAGRFRSLAQLYAFHGQQAFCYSYDDRDSLLDSSDLLISRLDELSKHTGKQQVSVIGHSMGGLVARKAMEQGRPIKFQRQDINLKLATVSAPLAGIEIANTCGAEWLHWSTLGIIPGLCWIVSGDNWFEITSRSDFIQQPGPLLPAVQQYIKVVTDERNTCRRKDKQGKCVESDFIFERKEQYHPVIDNYPRLKNIEIKAGHVEIVGNKNVVPRKLISILQQQGMLAPTPPERRAAFEQLLAELYR